MERTYLLISIIVKETSQFIASQFLTFTWIDTRMKNNHEFKMMELPMKVLERLKADTRYAKKNKL